MPTPQPHRLHYLVPQGSEISILPVEYRPEPVLLQWQTELETFLWVVCLNEQPLSREANSPIIQFEESLC